MKNNKIRAICFWIIEAILIAGVAVAGLLEQYNLAKSFASIALAAFITRELL